MTGMQEEAGNSEETEMTKRRARWFLLLPLALVLAIPMVGSQPAGAQTKSYYEGKQIRFIVHTAAGGGYDLWTRLVTRHWAKHIPGNPSFVVQNMPGGGGITAANYIYNQMPKDGTGMGMIGRNLPLKAVLGDKAVRFDPEKFGWIGSPEDANYVCGVKAGSPAETVEAAFKTEILMAGAGAGTGTSTLPPLLSSLLGLKLKLVEGYPSSTAGMLAVERGEVHGLCQSYVSMRDQRPGWIESGKLKILFNCERKPIAGLKAPSIFEFAKTDEQRQILTLFAATTEFGRPFITPPDVPADILALLQSTFEKAMTDSELKSEAAKQNLAISVMKGTELLSLVRDMKKSPPAALEKMRQLVPNP